MVPCASKYCLYIGRDDSYLNQKTLNFTLFGVEFRQILRMGRQWKSANPEETDAERRYILTEARTLFSRNAQVSENLRTRTYGEIADD